MTWRNVEDSPPQEEITKRYSPTSVHRLRKAVRGEEGAWTTVGRHEDATVLDTGKDGYLDAPQAMLKVYINDREHEDKHGERSWDDEEGMFVDADGDTDLERILGILLSKSSFGHGNEHWNVLVSWNDEEGEYNGWGFGDLTNCRVEKWIVYLADSEA